MTRLSEIDRIGDTQVSLAQRATQPSAGGAMAIFSPKTSTRRHVSPLGTEEVLCEQDVEPPAPGGRTIRVKVVNARAWADSSRNSVRAMLMRTCGRGRVNKTCDTDVRCGQSVCLRTRLLCLMGG